MLTIQEIRAALDRASHQAAAFTPDARHCAVAMILAPGERELEACFIRRAERHGAWPPPRLAAWTRSGEDGGGRGRPAGWSDTPDTPGGAPLVAMIEAQ